MEYRECDLPVTLRETETLTLDDGTIIRFEENGGARDVMINDEWSPRVTLFPMTDYLLDCGGIQYRLLAGDLDLTVAKA